MTGARWAVRSVVLLALRLLMPAGGRRRRLPGRGREKSPPDANSCDANDNIDPAAPPLTLRSPYSADHAPFDGNSTAMTRPYLSVHDMWLPEASTAAAPIGQGCWSRAVWRVLG